MRRLLTLLSLVIAASGCRMCSSPYDYCGPVVDSDCCGYPGGGPAMGANQGGAIYENAPVTNGTPTEATVIDGDSAPVPPTTWSSPSAQRQPMPARTPSR